MLFLMVSGIIKVLVDIFQALILEVRHHIMGYLVESHHRVYPYSLKQVLSIHLKELKRGWQHDY